MRASPDVESVPPVPMPTSDGWDGEPERPAGRAWGGLVALVLGWGFLLSTLFLSRGRITGVGAMRHVPVDLWVAIGSLALLVLGTAWWTWRTLKPGGGARERGDSQWSIAARHFRKNKLAIAGLTVMIILYVLTLLTPLIAPYPPAEMGQIAGPEAMGPSLHHWFGVDKFGRDILSRVLYGSRISLSIGFIAVAIGITLGTLVGALAGYYGGWVDSLLMRLTDVMLSFPRLVLLIVVIALFESSVGLVVIVLGLTGWMGTARIVRGEVLSLREREFVQAARALGMGDGRIIFKHVIPNTLAPVIVSATLGIGQTILTEASLSFLGLGVRPPTPSWGNMIADGRDALTQAWWISTFPGLAIVFTVIAFNLLGDGLRDALDPRLRT
ncbi:MAG TPA: oligopeptide ABC transporter permease [Longimicrobiaceae bacterium]|nr:oligopeptide ABC transporter permease [Longimicrobiaceae bacterium]